MEHHIALIEWESCGLSDIPVENLVEFIEELKKEISDRGDGDDSFPNGGNKW